MTRVSIETYAFNWLPFPLGIRQKNCYTLKSAGSICFKNSILGENMNHYSRAFSCFPKLSLGITVRFGSVRGWPVCTQSFPMVSAQVPNSVFTSYETQKMALFPVLAKRCFSISPQGLVKSDCTVIGRRIRPLEFVTHSNQIWKYSCSPLKEYYRLFVLSSQLFPSTGSYGSFKKCSQSYCIRKATLANTQRYKHLLPNQEKHFHKCPRLFPPQIGPPRIYCTQPIHSHVC